MQPYCFPYLGYFQLIACVDTFVVYDDVQYVRQSWINRNRILLGCAAAWLTLPVGRGSHRQLICEKRLHQATSAQATALERIRHAYLSAPHFDTVMALLEPLFPGLDETIASFDVRALEAVCDLLGIRTRLVVASEREYARAATAQERVIQICREEGAPSYVNAVRARALGLYDAEAFAESGLQLQFLRTSSNIRYDQGCGHFVPDLSIIDVLMFNGVSETRELLRAHTLEPP